MNINTFHRDLEDKEIGMNEIARIAIRTTKPLFFDRYTRNRVTGSLILIDEANNNVSLYVENNVLSSTNAKTFSGETPLLLTDYKSYLELKE